MIWGAVTKRLCTQDDRQKLHDNCNQDHSLDEECLYSGFSKWLFWRLFLNDLCCGQWFFCLGIICKFFILNFAYFFYVRWIDMFGLFYFYYFLPVRYFFPKMGITNTRISVPNKIFIHEFIHFYRLIKTFE